MKFVVVGGGVAAFEAALTIRTNEPEAEVVLFSEEEIAPYRRPALSHMVAEELSEAQFFLKPASFYPAQKIDLRLKTTVASVNADAHELTFADGTHLGYDRLVLATGGRGFRPPLADVELYPPLLLRSYADLQLVRRRIDEGAKSAVILGGGLLGLELADALLARGLEVKVIESCPQLLPRQLDPPGAEFFRTAVESGFALEFFIGDSPVAYLADGVKLASGKELHGDLVFAAAGVRPCVEMVENSSLAYGRGLIVDDSMRCSVPDVFAAGDCVEWRGRTFGLFLPARDMGRVAGLSATGRTAVFAPGDGGGTVRWQGFGLRLVCSGSPDRSCTGGVSPDGKCYESTSGTGSIRIQRLG